MTQNLNKNDKKYIEINNKKYIEIKDNKYFLDIIQEKSNRNPGLLNSIYSFSLKIRDSIKDKKFYILENDSMISGKIVLCGDSKLIDRGLVTWTKNNIKIKLNNPYKQINFICLMTEKNGLKKINFNENKIYREVVRYTLKKNSNNSKSIAENLDKKLINYHDTYTEYGFLDYIKNK